MSIYGPPVTPPRVRSSWARAGRLLVGAIVFTGLVSVGVRALLELQRSSDSERLEVERAEADRLAVQRALEVERLHTAELLPAVPEAPDIEVPPPPNFELAAPLPSPPAAADREAAPPRFELAVPLSPPAPAPAPLQAAEILH